ncbi:collectrin [Pseudophryne corroboree]|uniref:collectrin n=1 Tax=Pseudophryne corroboree TaxID=495146 RepID=UPI0030815BF3
MAFVMRAHVNNTIEISNILLCNMTQRVSFWFVVTSPSNSSEPIVSTEVENAIRLKRNRINSAFLLSDSTLEFVDIPPTFAPEVEASRPSWLIVFGVVLGVLGVGCIFFVVLGIKNKRKRQRAEAEIHDEDGMTSVETIENSEALSESTLF